MKLEITRTLIVSTSHIPKEDGEVFSESGNGQTVAYEYEYGWWVWTGEKDENYSLLSVFTNEILALARKNNCEWVRFDADGSEIEGLEKFDW